MVIIFSDTQHQGRRASFDNMTETLYSLVPPLFPVSFSSSNARLTTTVESCLGMSVLFRGPLLLFCLLIVRVVPIVELHMRKGSRSLNLKGNIALCV